MTKQVKITAEDQAKAQYFPLEKLYLHEINPRQDVPEEDIKALAESIGVLGLIQNLGGLLDKDGNVGIVLGGRRLRALQMNAGKHAKGYEVLVKLAKDEAQAEAWANAENTARVDLDPADEIRAYGRSSEAGSTVTAIATAFAVTEAHVYRRLKLASLPVAVLDALKAGKINISGAEAFTVSNDEKRTLEVLALLADKTMSIQQLKSLLQPASVSNTDRRAIFVGEDVYQEAGGKITSDMFSEVVYFENPDILDTLFLEKLQAVTESHVASGWKWIESLEGNGVPYDLAASRKLQKLYPHEVGLSDAEKKQRDELQDRRWDDDFTDDEETTLGKLSEKIRNEFTEGQKEVSGGFIYVGYDGEVRAELGHVMPEDVKAAVAAKLLRNAATTTSSGQPKSPYSQALKDDMKAIRVHAAQTALLNKPEFVLDLLGFFLSTASGDGRPSAALDVSIGKPTNQPKIEDGLTKEPRLEHRPDLWSAEGVSVEKLVPAFEAFRAEGKKTRNVSITEGLTRTLTGYDTDMLVMIEGETSASIRSIWTPTKENFFKRVGGPFLEELLRSLLAVKATDKRIAAFAKLKKGDKAEFMEKLFSDAETQKTYKLTAKQLARFAAWVPDCI